MSRGGAGRPFAGETPAAPGRRWRFGGLRPKRSPLGMAGRPPPCVVVLGMHRSGTSLLTGSLEAAGLYLGEVNNEAPWNRKGNKENEAIRDLNDALLAKGRAAWNAPPPGQVRWDRGDRERAKALIRPYLDAHRPWGFKDPRSLWTAAGWLRLLPDPRPIGVFRHPSLVVRSLVARSGDLAVGEGHALALWCAYNRELLRLHRRHRFPLLQFAADASFHARFLPRLAGFARSIGLHGAPHGFFDEALVHQVEPGPVATPEARRLFERLTQASHERRADA